MKNFFDGMSYLLQGFELISKPGIRAYVIVPFCLNLILFAVLFFLLQHYFIILNQTVQSYLPIWLQWLSILFWIFFLISFALFFVYAFVTVANLVAAPFNSLLAERVTLHLTGKALANKSWLAPIKDAPRVVLRQLAVIAYYLPRIVIVLVLFFIPVIQVIAPFLWYLFNAWYMSLTFFDYPSDNDQISFKTLRAKLHEQPVLSLGFGSAALIASMIPLVNLVAIPAAIAGACQCWAERMEKNQ